MSKSKRKFNLRQLRDVKIRHMGWFVAILFLALVFGNVLMVSSYLLPKDVLQQLDYVHEIRRDVALMEPNHIINQADSVNPFYTVEIALENLKTGGKTNYVNRDWELPLAEEAVAMQLDKTIEALRRYQKQINRHIE